MEGIIHQLKIEFQVTPEIQRYVYVYIIEGRFCYLIDSGIAGAELIIENYLRSIGRRLTDLRGIFLTHAHPDHIGGAARLRELTGCKVYASAGERPWIEDIDLQFAQRPIPNFYTLVSQSVPVDQLLLDGDRVEPEEGLIVQAVGTPGHSCGQLSYLLPEQRCIFTGDAIPVVGNIPIWIQAEDSRKSLEKLRELKGADTFYPAWDATYDRALAEEKIDDALRLMERLQETVNQCRGDGVPPEELAAQVCLRMGTPQFLRNPLFQRTVASCLQMPENDCS